MTIAAIAAAGAADLTPLDPLMPAAQASAAGGSFEAILGQLRSLNSEMLTNESSVSQLALGRTDNLHQVIMTAERTRLDFELLLAVRNKVLEAYQELMRMQV